MDTKEEISTFEPPINPKDPAQLEKIKTILKNNFLTQSLNEASLTILANAMNLRIYEPNNNIVTYGDIGEEYFILEEGKVKVQVYSEGTDP